MAESIQDLMIRSLESRDQPALEQRWSHVFADDPRWKAPALGGQLSRR